MLCSIFNLSLAQFEVNLFFGFDRFLHSIDLNGSETDVVTSSNLLGLDR